MPGSITHELVLAAGAAGMISTCYGQNYPCIGYVDVKW